MKIQVHDVRSIHSPNAGYVGWPTIARLNDGRLVLAYSGNRQKHVCPFGQVHVSFSNDQGRTWTWPRAVVDGPLDDRDAGLLQTTKGTLLVTWFTSMAWQRAFESGDEFRNTLPPQQYDQWKLRMEMLPADVRDREMGCWTIRSTDGGFTWSQKIDTVANSPHGPIQLSDGTLLYPGKHRQENFGIGDKGSPFTAKVGAAASTDDGQSWKWHSDITPMDGHDVAQYHELHGTQAKDGRVVVHIRNHNEKHHYETLQTHSLDGGKTWAPVTNTGLKGFPNFLITTKSGLLITTYGHRFTPMGNFASVSEDHGRTWSQPLHINTDSRGDMGYPSTVEIEDNVFLTLWYDGIDATVRAKPHLRIARWSLQ